MRRFGPIAAILWGLLTFSEAWAQSAHLAALEGSAPAPVTEPLVGGLRLGLAGLFSDPTSAPTATGAFFGVLHSTYASVQLYHAVAAFRAGPRWSLIYAATEIKDLFDTSLTNLDPTLSGLRARALLIGLDGTVALGRVTVSAGIGSASDENVGERQGATLVRLNGRVSLWRGASAGVHWTQASGSVAGSFSGRMQGDLGMHRQFGRVIGGITVAVLKGALWQYSEVRSGISAGAQFAIDSILDLRIGMGRYTTAFGVVEHEWRQSASVGIALGSIRVAACYTGTKLGLGNGYGMSFGYEPR